MGLIDIILLAVALAMDCLTVSIVSGVIMTQRDGSFRFLPGIDATDRMVGHQPLPDVYGGL